MKPNGFLVKYSNQTENAVNIQKRLRVTNHPKSPVKFLRPILEQVNAMMLPDFYPL